MSLLHIRSLQRKLTEAGADAALLTDKLNQRYITGFPYDDGLALVTGDKAYLITDFRYIEAANAASASFMEVVAPGRRGLYPFVLEVLRQSGCKKLLFEEKDVSFAEYRKFPERLPGIEVEPGASAILTELRLVKDAAELDSMARAQALTDAAFEHILNFIQPDRMSEIEVALELENFMRKNGSEGVAFETIAVSGSASSRPHGVPRNQKLERGFLTMDFGAKVDGYCADMTRTVVLGKATAEEKKLYETVLRAQTEALAAAREGASCFRLDQIARNIIDGAGYEGRFGHSLGHGVGLFIHETTSLSPGTDPAILLRRGNTFTVEPGIYIEGLYGCRIEDLCCITPDGDFRDFTRSRKDLIEL